MHDIFISHSSKDVEYVSIITKKFEEKGLDFWISSHDIIEGMVYSAEIYKAIRNSKIFLILLSKNSYSTDHVLSELDLAFNKKLKIIPLCLDESVMPEAFQYYLNTRQRRIAALINLDEFVDTLAYELKEYQKNNEIKKENEDEKNSNLNPKENLSLRANKDKYLTDRPKSRSYFIGRADELREINKKLEEQNKLLLRGMGGMGKTEIAKKLFKDSNSKYVHLAWLNYNGNLKESIVDQIKEEKLGLIFDEDDDIDKRYDDIVTQLCNMTEKTLLVIDDFDTTFDEDLYELEGKNLYIIITSRNIIEEYDDIYEIENLKISECIELFKKHYKTVRDVEEENAAKNIIALSGYHTLTIELIAKTAKASHKTLNDFFILLKEKGFNINEEVPEKTRILYKDKQKKHFFDHLKIVFDISNLSEEEKNILLNISMLPSTPLNFKDVVDWLKLSTYDELNELRDKGWLQVIEPHGFIMHNLLQETVKSVVPFKYQKIQNLVKHMIGATLPMDLHNPYEGRKYADYGAFIIKNCKEENFEIANLLHNIAHIYAHTANIDTARDYALKAINLKQRPKVRATSMNLASSYNNLSAIVLEKGDLQEAVSYGRKAIDIVKTLKNESHPNYAKFCNNISLCYYYSDDLRLAKNYSKIAIKNIEKFYEQNSPELLDYYSNTSMIFSKSFMKKDYFRAIDYANRVESIIKEHFNENHPLLARFNNRLCETFINLADFDTASAHFETAINIGEEFLDKDDSELGRIYYNGFRIQKKLKNLLMEEDYLEKALIIKEKWYGSKNIYLIEYYDEMCRIYTEKGEKQKELECLLKSLSIAESSNDLNEADYYQKIIALLDPTNNEEAKKLKEFNNKLSNIYLKQKEFDKAVQYKLKSIEVEEKSEKSDDSTLFTLYNDIFEIYFQTEDFISALKNKQKAVDYFERLVDTNNHQLNSHYKEIIKLSRKTKDSKLELHYLLKSKDILEKTNSTSEIAALYRNIGNAYQSLGNFQEALSYLFKSLELWKRLQNKKTVASTLKKISDLYKEQNKLPEAKEYLSQALNFIESDDSQKKKRGDYYEAMIELLEVIGDSEEIKKYAKKILE